MTLQNFLIYQKKYITGPDWDVRLVTITQKTNSAILMSGGIDSWVLYNLLDKNIKVFTYLRTDGIDDIDKVKRLTGRDDIIGIPNNGINKFNFDYCQDWIMANFNIDEVFIATNVIPHLAYFPEFNEDGVPDRLWVNDDIDRVKTPFSHLYKYHIIDIARKNDIDITQTISCLRLIDKNCGQCWQCKERQWGFNQLSDKTNG